MEDQLGALGLVLNCVVLCYPVRATGVLNDDQGTLLGGKSPFPVGLSGIRLETNKCSRGRNEWVSRSSRWSSATARGPQPFLATTTFLSNPRRSISRTPRLRRPPPTLSTLTPTPY